MGVPAPLLESHARGSTTTGAIALRDLFDAIRNVVKIGCQWRYPPHDLPPWAAVYQQARRWSQAVFSSTLHTTFERLFDSSMTEILSHRQQFSMDARFNRRQRAEASPAMTVPRRRKGRKSILP